MKITGGCNCGNLRYELDGEPTRVGLCHCETCRKETGSAFSYFSVWLKEKALLNGEARSWSSKAGARYFCPQCGSSVYSAEDTSDEIRLGTLAPSPLRPIYELWTIRREDWQAPIPGTEQWDRDRTS